MAKKKKLKTLLTFATMKKECPCQWKNFHRGKNVPPAQQTGGKTLVMCGLCQGFLKTFAFHCVTVRTVHNRVKCSTFSLFRSVFLPPCSRTTGETWVMYMMGYGVNMLL